MTREGAITTQVLLVEDDPGFQLLIQRILERMDPPASVDTVEDGATALRWLEQRAYDLALLDYSLPGRNGLDVLRDLKALGSSVPVVMVTGMGNETVAVDALKLGAHDYLVKSGDLKTALPLVVRRVIEKVRLEDGLRRYSEENERLRELDRLKSQFIANVSHELRTPLVSIAGYTDMLQTGHLGPLTADQRRALQVCSRNAERLKVLIDNILNLSSLEAHKVKPVRRPFDMAAVVRGRADAILPACQEKRIEVRTRIEQPALWVAADPDLMEQVLWNLLSNAHKFTPEGGTITITAQRSGAEAVIEVTDTGCGIHPDHRERIFERFWQADSSPTRRYPGLGIGLAIVKEILDAHGVRIEIRSQPDAGSAFSFRLPSASGATDGEGEVTAPMPRAAAAMSPRVVLVVDDEADTREFVKTALEMAGHRVALAEGGREALRLLRASRVDLVLLDIAMQDLSGLDVLRELRTQVGESAPPVVLLTAIADPKLKETGLREGACGILEKPLRTSTLLAAIERHMGREPGA